MEEDYYRTREIEAGIFSIGRVGWFFKEVAFDEAVGLEFGCGGNEVSGRVRQF